MGTTKDTIWADAIRRAVNRYMENPEGGKAKYLNVIADRLVDKAAFGDAEAVRELGNRLDGRSVTPIEAKIEGDVTITWQK
jgi:hypothetical protein